MDKINIVWTTYGQEGLVEGTEERVRLIDGYDGYFITDYGRVVTALGQGRRTPDFDNIIEKAQQWRGVESRRYWNTTLWNKGKRKNFFVHRLVALAFIPNPNNLPKVDHLNYPSNHYKDLEWVSQRENVGRGKCAKEHLIQFPNGDIKQIRNLSGFIMEYVRPDITHNKARGYGQRFKKLVKPKNGYKYIGLVDDQPVEATLDRFFV